MFQINRKSDKWWFLGDPGSKQIFFVSFLFLVALCEKVLGLDLVEGKRQ